MAAMLIDAIIKSKEIFHRNADTLVAGFLVRHPDIDPADVELVMTPMDGGALRFTIEPKELHVPLAINASEVALCDHNGIDIPEDASHEEVYAIAWNDCRQDVIDQKKAARSEDALVATLAGTIGDGNG